MNAPALARHKARLLALRDEIVREGDIAINPVRRDVTDSGGDEDEQPLAEMSQVIASKRNRARTDVLAKVTKALRRLDDSPETFGQCSVCDEPIGKRLDALPYVEMCVACQQEQDGDRKAAGRRRHLMDFK